MKKMNLKRLISFILILTLLLSSNTYAFTESTNARAEQKYQLNSDKKINTEEIGNSFNNIVFLKNNNQHDKSVEYYVHSANGTFFYDKKGVMTSVMTLDKEELLSEDEVEDTYWAFRETLLESNKIKMKPKKSIQTKFNFLVGDEKNHLKNVKGFQTLDFGFIYDGISMVANINEQTIEKIYTVTPSGLVNDIKIQVDGVNKLLIDDTNELIFVTEAGRTRLSAPYAYQIIDGVQNDVEVKYSIDGINYGFVVGEYNNKYDLIIDPAYICSYFGNGMTRTTINDIASDSNNNIFLVGSVYVDGFPAAVGAYDTEKLGTYDMFIAKMNNDFSEMLAWTFIGGDGTDTEEAVGIGISDDDRIYIAGEPSATGFPSFFNTYDTTYTSNSSVVFEMSNDLQSLVSGTYLDYSSDLNKLVVDSNGDVIIAGEAAYNTVNPSHGVETTSGTFMEVAPGNRKKSYISRFNSDLTILKTSTLFGSAGDEYIEDFLVSVNGDIIITGTVSSSNLPVTQDAYKIDEIGGVIDGFVAVLSNDFSTLKACTYLGTSALDYVYAVDEDKYGNIYVGGYSVGTIETTSKSYQQSISGRKDAYILKFNRSLTEQLGSTYLGSSRDEFLYDLKVSDYNEVIVTGSTAYSDFPLTDDAFDSTYANPEGFVTKFDLNLENILYSTFIGGYGNNSATDIFIDNSNDILITGSTTYAYLLPVTDGAFQTASSSTSKISFFFKMPSELTGLAAAEYVKNVDVDQSDGIAFGAFEYGKNLLSVQGALNLSFDLSYNSILLDDSSVGTGWRFNASKKLVQRDDSFIKIESGKGSNKVYKKVGDGYESLNENNQFSELTLDPSNDVYTLTENHQVYDDFENGLLKRSRLHTGESISYEYLDGLLVKIVEDRSTRFIDIVYKLDTHYIEKIVDNLGREVIFSYETSLIDNKTELLKTITYADGTVSTFDYNELHQLKTEVVSKDAENYLLFTNDYDAGGRLTSIDDNRSDNLPITYAYVEDSLSRQVVVERTNQDGKVSKKTYDYNYNLIFSEDESGYVSSNQYDDGVLIGTTDQENNENNFTYYDNGLLHTTRNPLNEVTTYTYDIENNLKSVSNAFNGTTSYDYNNKNQVISIDKQVSISDPDDYSSYDNNPKNAITTIVYETTGFEDLDFITTPDGYTNDYTINQYGQVENIDTGSSSVSYGYDEVGRMNAVTDSLGNPYEIEYLDNNQIHEITNPLLQIQTYDYYAHGGIKSVSNYEGELTEYKYDQNFNLNEILDPIVEVTIDKTIVNLYDITNRLKDTTDRNGNGIHYVYFDNGWLKRVTNDEGVYSRYEYYNNGQIKAIYQKDPDITDAEKKVVEYTYNALGNTLTISDALNHVTSNGYDNIGRLTSTRDAENNETQFMYDELNRLVESTNVNLDKAKNVYTLEGRVKYIQDTNDDFTDANSYLHKYEYDSYGRLETIKDSGITKASLTYLANSNLLESSLNGRAQSTTYTYDDLNRVESV